MRFKLLGKGTFIVVVILIVIGASFSVLALESEGLYHFDDASRYLLTRYVYQHPDLLVDTLNRPTHMVLSAPFSQFGFKTARFANVAISLLTCFVGYLLAKRLNLRHAWIAPFFIAALPIFAYLSFSSLAEPTFGLCLVIAVLFYYEKRYVLSAIFVSSLTVTRPEGFLYLALWLVLLIAKRSIRASTMLFAFPAVWFVVAWLITGNPLAIFKPDTFHGSAVQTGYSIFTYAPKLPLVVGPPLFLLIIVGLFYGLKNKRGRLLTLIVVVQAVALTAAVVFLANQDPQLRYWDPIAPVLGVLAVEGLGAVETEIHRRGSNKREASSLSIETGLVDPRVWVVTIVISYFLFVTYLYVQRVYLMYTFELVSAWLMGLAVIGVLFIKKRERLRVVALIGFSSVLILGYPGRMVHPLPLQLQLWPISEAAQWVRQSYSGPIASNDPFFWVAIDIDPWASSQLGLVGDGFDRLASSGLVVWGMRGYSISVPARESVFPDSLWAVLKEFQCPEVESHCSVFVLQRRRISE